MAQWTFDSFLKKARQHANAGAQAEADLMYLLLEVEPLVILWSDRYRHWIHLLKDLQLTSPTRYAGFKKANSRFSKTEITRLGVSASILLARISNKNHCLEAKEKALEWWHEHRVPMPPKIANRIVARVDPDAVPTIAKLTPEQWRQRTYLLEAILMKHGLGVPPRPQGTEESNTIVDTSVAFVRAQYRLKQLYPSCSNDDLTKIAMQQVETASASLKHALNIRKIKTAEHHIPPSTQIISDETLDKQIAATAKAHPNLVTSGLVLDELDIPIQEHHRVNVRQRILERMKATTFLRPLGKVGSTKAFAYSEDPV